MPDPQPRYRVTVLVLGDLGRSPRMLNQAAALAEDGAQVALAGYQETPIDRAVSSDPRIRVYAIRSLDRASDGSSRGRFLLVTALRTAWLAVESLWLLLVRTPRPDAVLVQNPPTIPTLLIAWIAARLRGSLFVIDWHNFGYTMLAVRLHPAHFLVRRAKTWERWLGRRADVHFCVSMAMRRILVEDFGLKAPIVLRDKPRELLPTVSMKARSAAAQSILNRAAIAPVDGAALAICPTSWTADEDMDLLLEGLKIWDSRDSSAESPQKLMVLITGRGPLRELFERRLVTLEWRRVIPRTAFLDPSDYRDLLQSAHLGFSLHRSTSGVDLPMKIMDFFGARTPACVLDYGPCLREQIEPGRTALTFRDGAELADRIDELLRGFPGNPEILNQMQHSIEESYPETWRQAWQREAGPVFRRMGP